MKSCYNKSKGSEEFLGFSQSRVLRKGEELQPCLMFSCSISSVIYFILFYFAKFTLICSFVCVCVCFSFLYFTSRIFLSFFCFCLQGMIMKGLTFGCKIITMLVDLILIRYFTSFRANFPAFYTSKRVIAKNISQHQFLRLPWGASSHSSWNTKIYKKAILSRGIITWEFFVTFRMLFVAKYQSCG